MKPDNYMNPYLAGIFLGLVLLASYLILGAGLGASGGIARLGAALEAALAPQHTQTSAYFGPWGPNYLSYYLVFMLLGAFLGGLISAVAGQTPPFHRGTGSSLRGEKSADLRPHWRPPGGFCQPAGSGLHLGPGLERRRHAPDRQPGLYGVPVCQRLCGGRVFPGTVA